MEKKRNEHRKNHKKRNIIAALTLTGMIAVTIIVAVTLKTKSERVTGFIQRADYMKGETELINSVDDVYDKEQAWQTSEEITQEENTTEQTDAQTKETSENVEHEKTSEEAKAAVERAVVEAEVAKSKSYKKLDVKCVLQNPELPTGCEITALTIVLNYIGYDVDKLTMADNFLDKGKVGETSPYKAFVGNPRDENSCGAFAPVLVNSARKYLASKDSDMNVYNVTGADYNELVEYVDQGHPVLVWETMWMAKPHDAAEWHVDGETIVWKSHEHAMVLIGYTADTYIMADPLRGIYEYDKDVVEERYKAMGKQAIVIY